MRRPTAALLVASAFTLALLAAPAAGAQTEANGNETVVGAEIGTNVSDGTAETVVAVLEARLDEAAIDGHVETVTANETWYVAVVTDADRDTVVPLLRDRGRIEIVARYPVQGNGSTVYREETLLTNDDFTNVGPARAGSGGVRQPQVPATIEEGAARNYSQRLQETGFTEDGIGSCPPDADRDPHNASGYCLFTVDDGEVRYAASMGSDLAQTMNEGEFAADPSFVMTAENMSVAERLSRVLRTGALPVALTVTDLPESVEQTALSAAENATAAPNGTNDGSTDERGDDTPDESTRAAGTTAESTTTGPTTAATTESNALGPGFTPVVALVAIVLASATLVGARLR
ncbi:hypothetical protein BV210_12665 [Halorientalis sp. IM1011]|uniref:hypothetical protein n=1 Tax=Halorientalis sp. IM1011 TaxID=1932360 RepID=UPI00097CD37D|nr:hypothetical protein [Halorientalis sp. IM1011]AQL43493.1 hypothetical protein BV210_12665 [Halorientalis sp. IM1011]